MNKYFMKKIQTAMGAVAVSIVALVMGAGLAGCGSSKTIVSAT